jgi:hypothetical protein
MPTYSERFIRPSLDAATEKVVLLAEAIFVIEANR